MTHTIDETVDKVITACEEGCEWRHVVTAYEDEHYIYSPKKGFYDNELIKNIKETCEKYSNLDFKLYSLIHPIKMIKYILAVNKMLARAENRAKNKD